MFEHGDEITKASADFFDANYNLVLLHLNDGVKKYLGSKDNRTCRFCGKNDKETIFRNISHAIPEFIGNKLLIAYYECDFCNSKFSTLLENHLAHYMNLEHTLSQVKGKKGVPSFKSNKKLSRIDVGKESVELSNFIDDTIAVINEKEKTLTITANRPSYIPVAVFKCFVKMALTILPNEELKYFEKTLDWINEEKHDETEYKFHNLNLLKSFKSGVHPFNFVTLGLLKRKLASTDNVPYMLFFVAYSNYMFQIHLPLCTEDL